MNRRSFVGSVLSALAAIPLAAVGAKAAKPKGPTIRGIHIDEHGTVHCGPGATIENCNFTLLRSGHPSVVIH